ncbi:MAG: chemotaxis protein CheX [Spirochaetia bacterium]|nr:chemotaxis protein CheX [Spirochaetia bacterium]
MSATAERSRLDLDYINAFVLSFYDFLKTQIDVECTKGRLQLKSPRSPIRGVAVLVGISGDVAGTVLIEMDLATAHNLSEKMNQEPSTEINDMFLGTIREFGNMVCGAAIVRLDKMNKDFNISPPTIILGEHMVLGVEARSEILSVPYLSALGQIDLNIFVDLKTGRS